MALHGPFMVNNQVIGHYEIQRLAPSVVRADSIGRYRYKVELDGTTIASGQLTHRYGDGAIALVAKVLARCGP